MKKSYLRIISFLGAFIVSGMMAGHALAFTDYYMANGGSYWTQSGSEWHIANNDGYCVSGRGPCGSNLWYSQWSYNHSGCGSDEWANYSVPANAVVTYNGTVSAWIDSVHGDMYGADYSVGYNYGSSYSSTVNQNIYYEAWAPVVSAPGLWRISNVGLTDGWGAAYACNTVSGKQVEFDEVRLRI